MILSCCLIRHCTCFNQFLILVNASHNITESEDEYWSRVEKSVLGPILGMEMVLGVLGNGLVLVVKIVVRATLYYPFNKKIYFFATKSMLILPDFYSCLSFCFALLLQCKDHFRCVYWLPFISLTLSDFFCSILIICGSLLAVLSKGQISPWCEVVSLLKFTFITSSIGSIGVVPYWAYVHCHRSVQIYFPYYSDTK